MKRLGLLLLGSVCLNMQALQVPELHENYRRAQLSLVSNTLSIIAGLNLIACSIQGSSKISEFIRGSGIIGGTMFTLLGFMLIIGPCIEKSCYGFDKSLISYIAEETELPSKVPLLFSFNTLSYIWLSAFYYRLSTQFAAQSTGLQIGSGITSFMALVTACLAYNNVQRF